MDEDPELRHSNRYRWSEVVEGGRITQREELKDNTRHMRHFKIKQEGRQELKQDNLTISLHDVDHVHLMF